MATRLSLFLILVSLTLACGSPAPVLENTVKLTQPVVETTGGNPYTIVSEMPVPSGLANYWLVAVEWQENRWIPVLVDRGNHSPPIDFLMPGRKLHVKLITFGAMPIGESSVYVGTVAH